MITLDDFEVNTLLGNSAKIAGRVFGEGEGDAGLEPAPPGGWRDWIAARVDELDAAIAMQRPDLFASQVRWATNVMVARGFSADRTIELLRRLADAVRTAAPTDVGRLGGRFVEMAIQSLERPVDKPRADEPRSPLVSEYLLTLLKGERRAARDLILDAALGGEDVRTLYLRVLLPALEEIGRMWEANEITPAEEHFATFVTRLIMAQLESFAVSAPPNDRTVLLAAASGNYHDVGLIVVGDFFEFDGWRVVQLGANVPVPDVVEGVQRFGADVVALSVSLVTQFHALLQTIESLRSTLKADCPKILVGGRAIASSGDLGRDFGADAQADDALGAVLAARQLIELPMPVA